MTAQVLFFTGASDPRRCALSPVQRRFLAALPEHLHTVDLNFPYDVATPPWRPVPLWLASLRHVGHWARRRQLVRPHRARVIEVFAQHDVTVVLAGSIGLELLGQLDLPQPVLARTHVFAYGGFATTPPACHTFRVCSRHDRVARRWPADAYVDAGHLDYLEQPEVLQLALAFIEEVCPA